MTYDTIKAAYNFNYKACKIMYKASLRIYNRYAKDSLAGKLYKQANMHRKYMQRGSGFFRKYEP